MRTNVLGYRKAISGPWADPGPDFYEGCMVIGPFPSEEDRARVGD